MEQVEKNHDVHVVVGGDSSNYANPHLNIQGKGEVLMDLGTKKKFWNEHLAQFFKGPEDPNYAILKIAPQVIEYMCGDALEPEVYNVAA